MTDTLSYEQTIELEQNTKLANKAQEIYKMFLDNVKLSPKNYKGDGRFIFWSDYHNAIYFRLAQDGNFDFQCLFLHETYYMKVTPAGIFDSLKNNYRGVDHLIAMVRPSDH
jgi:hypothetical protein